MNCPFAASDVHMAPLSEVDDGFNDIVILRGQNGGKIRMARLLLALDNGEFFTEAGSVHRNLPIDYLKAKTWELRPRVKTTPHNMPDPNDSAAFDPTERADSEADGPRLQSDVQFDTEAAAEIQHNENSFFSIDGERYPAQDVVARVCPQVVRFYF